MSQAPSPVVDIGLPAYRRPQYIAEALESVLAQTYPHWRLVVSENGPGGGDVEAAVQPYTGDPRITYEATGENIGPAANWTRLLQRGSAPYFSVIQDDDTWDPEFLARRVEFLERHPECGFVYSGERQMDEHGRLLDSEQTRSLAAKDISDLLPSGVYQPREFVRRMYTPGLGGIHPPSLCSLGVMSRRSALEAVGPVFGKDYPFCYWDVELYMRMAVRFPVGFMAIKDATQRIHPASITGGYDFDGEYWIRYHAYHGEWFTRELPGFKMPRGYYQVYATAHVVAALDALERDERSKTARHLARALRLAPSSVRDPRLAATAVGLLLGRRGRALVSRLRAARHARGDQLVYADEGAQA